MNKWKAVIPAYVLAHFMVDFACAFLMFRILRLGSDWYIGLLIYNFCAFALQMPIGLLADRFNHNAICASVGCGLVALAFLFGSMTLPAAVLAGVGNGMFHIGGGIEVLNAGKEKPALLGIFVSPGALGIYLGTLLGKQRELSVTAVMVGLIVLLVLILLLQYIENKCFRSGNVELSLQGIEVPWVLAAIGGLMLVVILRSYIGMIAAFPWKSDALWAGLGVGAVVLGKLLGGILALWLGIKRTSILSLGVAAVLFLFSDIPLLGVAAMFCFNMTMPLTLWAVARLLSGCKGFAFGILTFGLFLGFLPSYLALTPLFSTTTGFSIASVFSLVILLYGLRRVVDR